jgi:hypothetical protein
MFGCWICTSRLDLRRKYKANEHKNDEKWQNCGFGLNQWIHVFIFLFPAELLLWNRGSGRDEEPAGKDPPPDSDPFGDASRSSPNDWLGDGGSSSQPDDDYRKPQEE